MKKYIHLLLATALLFFAMGNGVARAASMQKPAWVDNDDWKQPPFFKLRKSFIASDYSNKKLGNINNGLLHCKADIREDMSLDHSVFSGKPDLTFDITIPDNKSVYIPSHGSGYSKRFSIKLNHIKVNQTIHFHIEDYDIWGSNDIVGDIELTYVGARIIRSRNTDIEMQCLILNSQMLRQEEARQSNAFLQFSKASSKEILAHPNHNPRQYVRGMQKRILGLAALGGWDSLAVQSALKTYVIFEHVVANIIAKEKNSLIQEERTSNLKKLVGITKAGTPVSLSRTTLKVFVESVKCGSQILQMYPLHTDELMKSRCIVKVGIKNHGEAVILSSSLNHYGNSSYNVSIINQHGDSIEMTALGITRGSSAKFIKAIELRTNEEATLLFTPERRTAQGLAVYVSDSSSSSSVIIKIHQNEKK